MKVIFQQSGGFAGLIRGCELNTDDLPAAEAKELQSLVKQSRLKNVKGGPTPGARDLMVYEIIVETGDEVQRVSFDELSVPERVEPLIDFLQGRAKPQRLI
jgi:hypothetical protein